MLKVLIAEDEMLVRIGLKNSIDWEKLGMAVIADVANGQAAWEAYEAHRPDLILTDIRMPIMDGMELIARIREQDEATKFIILTVYEEFDLVRKSLKLGVSDYILKLNMSIEEMESVLAKLADELRTARDKSSSADASQDTPIPAQADLLHLRETTIKEFMFYGRYSEHEFAGLAGRIRLRLQPERIVVCVMAIDKFDQMEHKFKDSQGNLIRFSLLNIMTELLDGYGRGDVVYEKDEKYLLLFSFADIVSERQAFEQLQVILVHIQSVIKKYLNATVTFGVSTMDSGFGIMKRLYRECASALDQRYVIGEGGHIRWQEADADSIRRRVAQKLERAASTATAFHERYVKEIEAGIKAVLTEGSFAKPALDRLIIRWIHWPTVNGNVYMDGISAKALDYAERIHGAATLDEALAIFDRYVEEIRQFRENKKAISKEIAEAAAYIREHYAQDISLQQLADHVQLNASYLSTLFKKELQLAFVDYLHHYRIDRAKEMLVNTHLKSYQIAEQVGFMDDSYFSRIFKKITSMRPNEFRKRWFVENGEERHDADDGSMG